MEPRDAPPSNQWYEKVELLEHLQEEANNTPKTKTCVLRRKTTDPTAPQIFSQNLLAVEN
jgi:hypothetical protein